MQGVTGSSPVVSTKKEEVALAVTSSFLAKLRLEQLTHLCVNLVRIPPLAVYYVIRRVRPTNSRIRFLLCFLMRV